MGILIGTDEAGYGPQLGPLVVAATAWEVAEEKVGSQRSGARGQRSEVNYGLGGGGTQSAIRNPKSEFKSAPIDLYRSLKSVVSRVPSDRKVAIADSKQLYKPGLGLRQLERGLHAVLRAMEQSLDCWASFVDGLAADPAGHHRALCWHDDFNCSLPVDADGEELAKCGERMLRGCASAGVRPLVIRARLVFPAEFNELCAYHGSKGMALSHVTIGLMREVVEVVRGVGGAEGKDPLAEASSPVFAICDKHGGRNFYTALLQHHFPEHWIRSVFESRYESRYEWGGDEERMQVVFRTNGEEFLPTALASMTAKYLRELSMRAFNEFWCARVPNLRPTAGYYGDSSRFQREVIATQRELGIEDRVMWRER